MAKKNKPPYQMKVMLSLERGTATAAKTRPGGPLVLLWWQVVVRPRHRWWALAAALGVTIGAYLGLHRLILAGLPFPWDGVVSFAVAGWLGAFAYVSVTLRPTAPFSHRKAAEGSKVTPGEVYEARFGFTRSCRVVVATRRPGHGSLRRLAALSRPAAAAGLGAFARPAADEPDGRSAHSSGRTGRQPADDLLAAAPSEP